MPRKLLPPASIPDESQVPYSAEAEKAVLASCLIGGIATFRRAAAIVAAEDFFLPQNRRAFAAMGRLATRGVEIDPVTLAEEMARDAP